MVARITDKESCRYYTKYNTLTDTHKFLTKEISILNSISSKYAAVSASETQKAAFLAQIDTIQAGVKDNLTRVEQKEAEEMAQRDGLSDKLNKVLDKQRLYFKAVQTFQHECKRNEVLRSSVQQQQPASVSNSGPQQGEAPATPAEPSHSPQPAPHPAADTAIAPVLAVPDL